MPKIGAGFLARKREARPSPENLPPGEGRGGAAATGKSSGRGGGAARSAKREDSALQDAQRFLVAVGDQRSPSFFLFSLAAQRRIALARTPRRAPCDCDPQGRIGTAQDDHGRRFATWLKETGRGPFGQGGRDGTLRAKAGLPAVA